MTDACFVGHVAIDHINQKKIAGGSCLYGGLLMSALNQKTTIVTSASDEFLFSNYPEMNWLIQKSQQTTEYEHVYVNNQRISVLLNKADIIEHKFIPDHCKNSKIVMLGPITDEIRPEIANHFSSNFIGLTPQGWFRTFDPNGKMRPCETIFKTLPKKIKLIVVSEDDIQADPASWKWIQHFAEVAVRTMGKDGYILSINGNEKKYEPMQIMDEVNPTGCGDLFATGMLFLLSKGLRPEVAAKWAGHAAGLASTKFELHEKIQIAAGFLRSKIEY